SGGIDDQVVRADVELTGGQRDVLRAENILELGRIVAILRQALLRVIEVNLLRQDARARNLRGFRDALQRALQQFGVIVEVAIGILCARDGLKSRVCVGRVANDGRVPGVGVNLGAVKVFPDQLLATPANGLVVDRCAGVEANVTRSLEEVKIGERFVPAGN